MEVWASAGSDSRMDLVNHVNAEEGLQVDRLAKAIDGAMRLCEDPMHDDSGRSHVTASGSTQMELKNQLFHEQTATGNVLAEDKEETQLDIPTKYAPLLHTNHIPSSPSLTSLHTYSSTLTTTAHSLETTLETLQTQLAALEAQRTQLQEAAAPYAALGSVFRRFPPEVLQLVFLACLPEGRNAVMHESEAPVVLGRVCRAWRRLVMGTPGMWASLHIVPPNYVGDPGYYLLQHGHGGHGGSVGTGTNLGAGGEGGIKATNEAKFSKKRDLVEMWLGRSGACPLSISFVWFGGDGDEEMRLCGMLLDVIVPLSRRWRSLEFQAPLKVFKAAPFAQLGKEDVPMLRGLSLTDNRSSFEMDVMWPESLRFARDVEGLRKLSLTFFSGGMRLPEIHWERLSELYLESNVSFFFRDGAELMETLGECLNLEVCTLKFPLSHTTVEPVYGGYDYGPGWREPRRKLTEMPKLRSLCLDGDQNLYSAFHVTTTLAGLRVPRLKVLDIFGRNGPPDGGIPPQWGVAGAHLGGPGGTVPPISASAAATDSGSAAAGGSAWNHSSDDQHHNDYSDDTDRGKQSPEPLCGILQLLKQSGCPLERLRLESVTLLADQFIDCMRLAPTIKELVLRDYGWSVGVPNIGTSVGVDGRSAAENAILSALTVRSPRPQNGGGHHGTLMDGDPLEHLCPKLVEFDVALCDASQELFRDFVESRYRNVPENVERLRTVRCAFTAREEKGLQKWVDDVKEEGLDVQLTFHLPIPDEVSPSPWTGVEGL